MHTMPSSTGNGIPGDEQSIQAGFKESEVSQSHIQKEQQQHSSSSVIEVHLEGRWYSCVPKQVLNQQDSPSLMSVLLGAIGSFSKT